MRRTSMTLGLLLLPAIAAAQSASDPVTAQLDRINATLKQIVELLNHQSDAQDLDLLMKRVQLGQSQVAELERRLHDARAELRSVEAEEVNFEGAVKVLGEDERQTADVRAAEVARMEAVLKRVRQHHAQAAQDVATLESELATRRDELRSWQAALDRRLSKHSS